MTASEQGVGTFSHQLCMELSTAVNRLAWRPSWVELSLGGGGGRVVETPECPDGPGALHLWTLTADPSNGDAVKDADVFMLGNTEFLCSFQEDGSAPLPWNPQIHERISLGVCSEF